MENPPHPLPKVCSSETVYKGFFDLRLDLLQLPHGPKRPYTVLEVRWDAAALVAETAEGKWVISKEYRHPTGHWILGCPGGRIDPGESPIEAGRRELLEETGYTAEEFLLLGTTYPFAAVTKQRIYYIWAKGAKQIQQPKLEEFELIQAAEMNSSELKRAIQSGELVDGILCTALHLRSLQDG